MINLPNNIIHTEKEENFNLKGLKVKTLSIVLVILEAIFVAISIICAVVTTEKYNQIDRLNQDYIRMQQDIYNIRAASDFLTARCRQYVMTGESEYAFDYYEEFNVTKRRENALDNVHAALDEVHIETNHFLDDALEESNQLALTELHAMALVYNASHNTDLPDEIMEYVLPDEEMELSAEQKQTLASEMVFSKNYSNHKLIIMEYVDKASNNLLDTIRIYAESCSKDYHTASITLKVMLIACALLFAIIVLALFSLILIPIEHSIESIKNEELIQYKGYGYELNYLAQAFNHLHNNNLQEKLKLKYTAERDSLTKLLNRNGYNEVINYYSSSDESIALIILDADNFKDINDGFGHEAGDIALKRIADLLLESFRNEDYVFRYGGDEFVVIMTDITIENKNVVSNKLKNLNDVLLKENKPGGPKLSLSIGATFSEHGYNDELFKKADRALYQTKENGRCGYTFSDE